jgi:hypothetical protein
MDKLIIRNKIITDCHRNIPENARDDLGRLMGNSKCKNNEYFVLFAEVFFSREGRRGNTQSTLKVDASFSFLRFTTELCALCVKPKK